MQMHRDALHDEVGSWEHAQILSAAASLLVAEPIPLLG